MKITWLGRSCFELVADDCVVITDPYHPQIGYPAYPRRADIVTISHEHGDHNHTGWMQGNPVIMRGAGSQTAAGVTVTGYPSFHDDKNGAARGANTVFAIEADGLHLCHLGDLGHEPGEDLYRSIGKPDVLFIPVGGYYTIDGRLAAAVARLIGARLTVAMHFKTSVGDANIETAEPFINASGAAVLDACSIEMNQTYDGPKAVVLDFLR